MTRTPSPARAELIAVRVMREQDWAYARRLEHYSYAEMRRLVREPESAGGLGYDLSEPTLKRLVTGYVERMRDTLDDGPELTMARELADLDRQHRALARLTEPIDWAATTAAARSLGYNNVDEAVEAEPGIVVLRDDKVVIAALSQLRAVGESRRKLLGLDAPIATKVDVTVHDAVTDELNAMLARAGRNPIEVPQ